MEPPRNDEEHYSGKDRSRGRLRGRTLPTTPSFAVSQGPIWEPARAPARLAKHRSAPERGSKRESHGQREGAATTDFQARGDRAAAREQGGGRRSQSPPDAPQHAT